MTMAAGSMCEVPDEGNEQGMTHTSDPSQQEYSLRDLASDDGVNLRKGEQETIEEVQKRNLSEKLEHKHYSSDFNSYAEVPEMSVRGRDRVEDYLLLQADTASLVGLTRFLVLGSNAGRVVNMGEQGSDVGGIAFELRCTIVFSIVVRWIICFFKKPMKLFGLLLEFFLNGDNLSCSIRNLLTGRIPERGSKNCLSAVGYLDTRVHLHKFCNNSAPEEKEKPGVLEDLVMMDICVMASKIVYENADVVKSIIDEDWKMHFVNLYNFWNEYRKETSTQAFIMCNKRKDADLILISFRGAKTFDASDLCMGFDYSWCHVPGMGKVHVGFLEALGLGTRDEISSILSSLQGPNPNLAVEDKKVAYYTLRNVLRDLLAEHPKAMFVVTGHGVGGALAALFPALLLFNEEEDLIKRWSAVYTFGQPRIGDEQLQMFMQPYAKKYFRVVYSHDIMPLLPYDDGVFLYKHIGVCLHYNSFFIGKIMNKEPSWSNFSSWNIVSQLVNSIWELIRGFLMGRICGREYQETRLMIMCRILGLIEPCLSAHMPTNYINCARLGCRV
ncbi:alpha/beta-Hydrolases superfamily protein [Rhynchospora pubera]|uniref:Alpha/beta-Hydrolases superfamily protein n=1 Tax=Rhynchospora pubera TaxID=906938 RepID=A0AAV8HM25_9POAL|nr:alpha/beta-Hydrolases superfamily protein [Rhynchospora pubera]